VSDIYGNAAALKEIESELGQTMILNGLEYPCIIGDTRDTKELDYGGYSTGSKVDIVVRAELFSTPPILKEIITINNNDCIINEIAISNDGSCYVISLDDADKDA
jgi:hypothetical protein